MAVNWRENGLVILGVGGSTLGWVLSASSGLGYGDIRGWQGIEALKFAFSMLISWVPGLATAILLSRAKK